MIETEELTVEQLKHFLTGHLAIRDGVERRSRFRLG